MVAKQKLPALLSVDDVANDLGIRRERAYRLVNDGDPPIPHVHVGRRIIVPREGYLRWKSGELGTSNGEAA